MMRQSKKRSAGRGFIQQLSLLGVAVGVACISAGALADPNAGGAGQNVYSNSTESSRVATNANTSVGNSRVIVADGTSLSQGALAGQTRWFAFGAEQGKTYTVEVLNPYGDLSFNLINSVGLFNADGTTAPSEAQTDCTGSTVAPSLEVSSDGIRCVIRTFVPTTSTAFNKRAVFIAVTPGYDTGFQIRVRESTIYGRWTTNGYDFHVELQNTTTDAVCAQVVRYPGTGTTPPTGTVTTSTLNVPAMGANKLVFANGSLAGGDNKGTLRIHACPGPTDFVAGSLQANTYAFNPVTSLFIPFSNGPANNGSTSNSW